MLPAARTTDEEILADAICIGMCQLEALGLNRGTSGNMSTRIQDGFLITPSGIATPDLHSSLMVKLDADGNPIDRENGPQRSSEWRFHRDIYHARTDVQAIVHVHSAYATALACQRRSLPAFHYMIAVAGGLDIRCAPYATFGSQALSDGAVSALRERRACLLANHGLIAVGNSLVKAIALAVEVEELARQYSLSCSLGEPVLLSESEMADVIEKFKTYGAAHGDK
jgi:L-fuculose-phosphate aldolase